MLVIALCEFDILRMEYKTMLRADRAKRFFVFVTPISDINRNEVKIVK